MDAFESFARRELEESAAVTLRTADECLGAIRQAANVMAEALRAGGKVLLCGNGGSAADCQHLAAELVNVLDRARPRPALSAIALTTDTALLTAVANDLGFERVFERQIEGLGRAGDVLLAISTSGDSPSIIKALECAKERGIRTVLLSGATGGAARALADTAILVPSRATQRIQEAHIVVGHVLCELVEQALSRR
jgi:D-sedoheptulose 7-phosphate isomerase